ncbi:uncharacterized protein PHALS_06618 [Plasmopara halstedii]|uniref:RxLR-like protein n=1 Tax=Plasmopara halstedii TaxID=4781 RepID=A0A0P1B489_PLAHL|nr:uncharacterized protein PHALS_06618 [Plasmopara halstedii]CEG48818.1 hypothetical protein PHALS_06618 [Plasmopara halstedii]|eukprot:XP_024585187.1 hypothetical protein PHALS_06618 [Plasmopara halstedii]
MLFVVLIFVVVRVTSASAIAHSTYPAVGGKSVDLGVPVSDVSHSNQSVSSSDDKKIDDIEERGQTSQMLGFIKGLTTRLCSGED